MNEGKVNQRNNQTHSVNIVLVNTIKNNMNKHGIANRNWAEHSKLEELVPIGWHKKGKM
jgi:hypothetical protein